MNLTLVAIVVGVLAGDFVSNFLSENIAHRFEDLYATGFYMLPPEPGMAVARADLAAEEAYLDQLCRLPEATTATD